MGYYTEYTLAAVEGKHKDEFENDLSDEGVESSYGNLLYIFPYGVGSSTVEPLKWYEHSAEMKAISEEYPDTLFTLDGRGEDGEVWRKYFFNGFAEVVKPTVAYPPPSTQLYSVEANPEKAEKRRRMAEINNEIKRLEEERNQLC